jgi:hypothetical protein
MINVVIGLPGTYIMTYLKDSSFECIYPLSNNISYFFKCLETNKDITVYDPKLISKIHQQNFVSLMTRSFSHIRINFIYFDNFTKDPKYYIPKSIEPISHENYR